MYIYRIGGGGGGWGMEWPALTLLNLGSGDRLQVISEVVSLSLFALEVTDPVCIGKFYTVPVRQSHAPFVCVYMQVSAVCLG